MLVSECLGAELMADRKQVAAFLSISVVFTAALLMYRPSPAEYVEHHPHHEEGIVGAERSSCWTAVREAYYSQHPACAACGTTKEINVHHCESFHEHPERECDPSNLLSLCRSCHLALGHRCEGRDKYNWSCTNPRVREDAELVSGWLKKRGKWPMK